MENRGDTLWKDLAIVLRDEINIQSIISELFQINHIELENLETLTISGSTLISTGSTTLHVAGSNKEKSFYADSSEIIFHALEDSVTSKDLANLLFSNNVRVKHLQIFLRGRANRIFLLLPSRLSER